MYGDMPGCWHCPRVSSRANLGLPSTFAWHAPSAPSAPIPHAHAVAARLAYPDPHPPSTSRCPRPQRYKKSTSGIISAAREQAGPLWKVQRRLMGKGQYSRMRDLAAGQRSPGQVDHHAASGGPASRVARPASPSSSSGSGSSSDSASDSEGEASPRASRATRPRRAARAPEGGEARASGHAVHLVDQDALSSSPAAAARARSRGRGAPSASPVDAREAVTPRVERPRTGRGTTPWAAQRAPSDGPSQPEAVEPSQVPGERPLRGTACRARREPSRGRCPHTSGAGWENLSCEASWSRSCRTPCHHNSDREPATSLPHRPLADPCAETPGPTQEATLLARSSLAATGTQQPADPAAALNLGDLDLASPAKRMRRGRP